MHPNIDTLKAELQSVSQLLCKPSDNDDTFRALLRELNHSEDVQKAINTWVPKATATLDGIVTDLTEASRQDKARIAELEAEVAELKATPILTPLPDDGTCSGLQTHPVDDITGYKRPPLRSVDNAG